MTMVVEEKRRLGRGLAALLGDIESEAAAMDRARTQRRVPVEFLRPNPRNPRKAFAEEDLAELAASIREKGIVQPILARPVPGDRDRFEIVAGERRWRAAQRAGLHEVPILIQDVNDREALELAIVENVQRADLNPLEEAAGYEQLIAEFNYSQQDLAGVIGKSRSHVANTMRLLKLPDSVKRHVQEGRLTAGHARALVTADRPEELAESIVAKNLTVRDVEALAKIPKRLETKGGAKPPKAADTRQLEKELSDVLGLDVAISHRANGRGELRVKYKSLEQLEDLCRRLRG